MCDRGAPPPKKKPVVGGAAHAVPIISPEDGMYTFSTILCAPLQLHTIQLHKIRKIYFTTKQRRIKNEQMGCPGIPRS